MSQILSLIAIVLGSVMVLFAFRHPDYPKSDDKARAQMVQRLIARNKPLAVLWFCGHAIRILGALILLVTLFY
jgi:hypothetical protein